MTYSEVDFLPSTIDGYVSNRVHPAGRFCGDKSTYKKRSMFRLHPHEQHVSLPLVSIDELGYNFQADYPHLEEVGAKLIGWFTQLSPSPVNPMYAAQMGIRFQSPNMKKYGQLQLDVAHMSLNLPYEDNQNSLREQMHDIADTFFANLEQNMRAEYEHRVAKLKMRGQIK